MNLQKIEIRRSLAHQLLYWIDSIMFHHKWKWFCNWVWDMDLEDADTK